MPACPLCQSEEYTKRRGCPDCGHYDEDAAAQRRRRRHRERTRDRHRRR